MIEFINSISDPLIAFFLKSSFQFLIIYTFAFLIMTFVRESSINFKYWLWMIILSKLLIPPFIHLSIFDSVQIQKVVQLTNLSIPTYTQVITENDTLSTSSLILLAWLLVVSVLFFRMIINNIRFHFRLQGADQFDTKQLRNSHPIFYKDLRTIPVLFSHQITTPLVLGLFKPKIFIPLYVNKLETDQIAGILSHELAHIKRYDVWINFLQNFLQIIYFFHPLVWLTNIHINNFREQICDDIALKKSQASCINYGKLLLHQLERSNSYQSSLSIPFFTGKKNLINRFRYLTQKKEDQMLRINLSQKLILSVLVVSLLFLSIGFNSVNAHNPLSKEKGSIFGTIKTNNGELIPGANIYLFSKKESQKFNLAIEQWKKNGKNGRLPQIKNSLGAASTISGDYEIKNVPAGEYILRSSMIGFSDVIFNVNVKDGKSLKVDFVIKPLKVDKVIK